MNPLFFHKMVDYQLRSKDFFTIVPSKEIKKIPIMTLIS